MVELIVEDEKYSKHGVHKGMCGCVMQDYAVQNYIEVDFSGIDENGNFYGDCISVKIDDLKVVEWKFYKTTQKNTLRYCLILNDILHFF